jgi:hypothetical protein
MENAGVNDVIISLVVDGIVGGLGAVFGFLPQMAVLFVLLSILEDCGYMVRIAFVLDRIFRRFGLSGKSFIPLIIGSGCGVPGIMASKTIENDNDRRLTIMTTTFIPCGAKLPVIALIAGVICGGAWWMAPVMYLVGIVAVLVSSIILKKTKPFSGEPAPFVMELPSYHIPSVKGILIHVWEKLWGFIKKAGTILFAACVVMWFLASFGVEGGSFGLVDDQANSMEPVLQTGPGEYNDTLLAGLDYLMSELDRRDMTAVLYLNNSWEWSGGYGLYLQWSGHGKAPVPATDGWPAYMEYVQQYAKSDSAQALFNQHVRFILGRENRYTHRAYIDDPAILSWQIGNEPRAFSDDNKEAFAQWMAKTSLLIKSLDHNHLVSTGSEGKHGCEQDIDLC